MSFQDLKIGDDILLFSPYNNIRCVKITGEGKNFFSIDDCSEVHFSKKTGKTLGKYREKGLCIKEYSSKEKKKKLKKQNILVVHHIEGICPYCNKDIIQGSKYAYWENHIIQCSFCKKYMNIE